MKLSILAGLAGVPCLVFVACGGSQPSPPAAPPASAAACGVILFGAGYDPFCQKTLDDACCAEEKTCAADATCKGLLEHVNACPLRKGKETDDCVMKVLPQGADTPGYAMINSIATCAKHRIPPSGDRCVWPD